MTNTQMAPELRILKLTRLACKMWGEQAREIHDSTEQGWHGVSLGERVMQLCDGDFNSRGVVQFPEEAFVYDGLTVARAIRGVPPLLPMPRHLRYVLFIHYAVTGAVAKQKADHLGISDKQYWICVAQAEWWIAARLSSDELCTQ